MASESQPYERSTEEDGPYEGGGQEEENNNGKLSWKERRFLALLGLPAFGISLAYTAATTYLPVILNQISGATVTGIFIGIEGIFALFVPFLVGAWSDSLNTRIGGRMPFILAGAALAVPALIVMPFGRGSLAIIAVALVAFFIAYFVYYTPYYALFPDLVPGGERGRAQGAQGAFRSGGLLLMLVGGGLLLELWQPLPFLAGAIAIASVTALFFFGARRRLGGKEGGQEEDGGGQEEDDAGSGQANWKADWELVRDNGNIRVWMVANLMWEAAVGALRAFVVLYFTKGLGFSLVETAGALALVGVSAIVAAPLSGRLADRYGHRPVMLIAVLGFGLGLLIPLFTTNPYFLIGILPVAFAAVVLQTLPFSVLMRFLPEDEHHAAGASLFNVSRGVGIVIGAMLAGGAVDLLRGVGFLAFGQTSGFAAIFLVASAFLLASSPLLFKMNMTSWREA